MTTQEVANRFVALVREGKSLEAQEELFSDDVENIEPPHSPMPGVKGKEAVMERLRNWYANVEEMHANHFTAPIVMGNHFTLGMSADLKMKGQERNKFEEICLYQVEDGKIVKEQYFF